MSIEKETREFINLSPTQQKIILSQKDYQAVDMILTDWQTNNFLDRFWNIDPTLWKEKKEDDKELSNRLGWLKLPETMKQAVNDLEEFADEIRTGFDNIVLLGMGGSSLAPEVFFKTYGKKEGYPSLSVLDSTHPQSVKKILNNYDLKKTAFIVASKSGGTAETMSFYYTFYNALSKITDKPGKNFIAITDANTNLEKLAVEKAFRRTFTTPAGVGGRYSALTYFGLLPAALIGVDIAELLKRSSEMMNYCSPLSVTCQNNPGFVLGAVLGYLSTEGKDKITIISSPKISHFPTWVEQLIAESTGKEGKGILPVVGEEIGNIDVYGNDRIFVHLRLKDDDNNNADNLLTELEKSGNPVITILLNDIYDLGHEFFRWEIATAMAGAVMKINPFNQPNVQLAKSLANEAMDNFKKTGKLETDKPVISENGISVLGDVKPENINSVLPDFLSSLKKGSYVALMGFLPYSEETDNALDQLRNKIREKYKIAVTVGYGPRFLHSTGQLHKGGENNGLFIQFTTGTESDLEVPGKGYSFGTLIAAQANGDMKALINSGRHVIRFDVEKDIPKNILFLASSIII